MSKTFEELTHDEAVKLAASVREEDIDTSDIPNLGGVTQWHKAEEHLAAKRLTKVPPLNHPKRAVIPPHVLPPPLRSGSGYN